MSSDFARAVGKCKTRKKHARHPGKRHHVRRAQRYIRREADNARQQLRQRRAGAMKQVVLLLLLRQEGCHKLPCELAGSRPVPGAQCSARHCQGDPRKLTGGGDIEQPT